MKLSRYFPVVLIVSFVMSACASNAEAPDAMVEKDQEQVMEAEAMTQDESPDESMASDDQEEMASDDDMMEEAAMTAPAWFSVPLVDVNRGETFSIEDLKGKVILVETMAVWCSNCLRQQREVQSFHTALGERDDFVSIALDIDPNENADILRNFADQHGFDWKYVVAPVEVASQIGQLYGQQFLNPPSTPILLIDRHGDVQTLPFGIKSATELFGSVEGLLNAEM